MVIHDEKNPNIWKTEVTFIFSLWYHDGHHDGHPPRRFGESLPSICKWKESEEVLLLRCSSCCYVQTHELSPPTAELQTHELSEQHTAHELSPHSKHNPLLQNVDSQLLSPSMHTGLCPHMLQYILHALYTEYELHYRCSVDCNDLRCSQDTVSFQAKSYVTAKSCIM